MSDHPMGILSAALLGLFTTSSSLIGALLGLHVRLAKRLLAGALALAAGSLIAALAIELAFESVQSLLVQGLRPHWAWAFISAGFALGAAIYYITSLALEARGGAVRYETRFLEYARDRKQRDVRRLIELLSRCELLRHLPPEEIEDIIPCVRERGVRAGEVVFRAGDAGDALYLVADGKVAILAPGPVDTKADGPEIATLSAGDAFGEMALLTGGPRTATVRASTDANLLEIPKADFDRLVASDPLIASAVERLSHGRAIKNLSRPGGNPALWAKIATANVDHLSRAEANRLLKQAGTGAGLAIVLGNILDTIPGCLVIGAKFESFASLSLGLMAGMFIGGIPEAAASATMLRRAGYRPIVILALWSTVLITGLIAAALGKAFIGSSESLPALFCQALAGGAVLALVTHAMIPEALHEGGSVIVLPTVAGFLFALYLAILQLPAPG